MEEEVEEIPKNVHHIEFYVFDFSYDYIQTLAEKIL